MAFPGEPAVLVAAAPFPFAGETAGLATAVLWSLTSIAFAVSSKRWGSVVLNRVRILLAVVFLSLLHRLVLGTWMPFDAEPERWAWLAASGTIGLAIGDGALFYAFNRIGPRKSMLLMSTVPLLSALLAWLFLGEVLTVLQVVAIFILVGGVAVVVAERSPGASAEGDRDGTLIGTLAALVGALSQAVGLIVAKQGMQGEFSTISATLIRMVAAGVVVWVIGMTPKHLRRSWKAMRDGYGMKFAIIGAIFGPFLGVWLSLVAVQYAPVGIASASSRWFRYSSFPGW